MDLVFNVISVQKITKIHISCKFQEQLGLCLFTVTKAILMKRKKEENRVTGNISVSVFLLGCVHFF